MNIILPDGKTCNLHDGANSMDLAKSISNSLAKKVVAAYINGELKDLSTPLKDGECVRLVTESDHEGMEILRHSTAHLMAQAVQNILPGVKVTIGPVIEDGFYYDFDFEGTFTPEILDKIEKEMLRLSGENTPIVRSEVSSKEAVDKFSAMGENYKVEIIEDLGADKVSLYTQGNFTDLCRGPHLPHVGKIKHFKLLSVAGAYWRGDEKNPQLQRIYGTAFFSKQELDAYLNMLEEAKKRDHRKLGRQLGLFMFDEKVGAGLPIYLPRGGILRSVLEQYERVEHMARGYDIVYGPTLLKKDMWVTSGHYDNYRENMYFTEIDEVEFGIKPMNCVNHMVIYQSELRSYRDLPIRLFELGNVHRHEKSGALHGLMRVRAFTQDDAHIFCRHDQLQQEIIDVLDFVKETMDLFGFEFVHTLSTRPEEKFIGSIKNWDEATASLKGALDAKGISYTVNDGDGAFYGPKIDIKLKDAIGRWWQCATVQCDFNLPERFDITYIGEDGAKHRPVMLHRVIFGSVDRFIGVLTEHFAGAFPIWIAPEQVRIMNITDEQQDYCKELENKLKQSGIRVSSDLRNEKIGFKIREAQMMKIPHMIIIGGQEKENNTLSIRLRSGESKNNLDFLTYLDILSTLEKNKSLNLWR